MSSPGSFQLGSVQLPSHITSSASKLEGRRWVVYFLILTSEFYLTISDMGQCGWLGGSSYLFPSKGASISAASAILVNMQLSALHLHHLLKVFSFIHSMPHPDFIFVIRAIGICLHISQTFCPHHSCCQSLHLSLALLFFDLKTFQACHTHQHLSRCQEHATLLTSTSSCFIYLSTVSHFTYLTAKIWLASPFLNSGIVFFCRLFNI